MTMLNDCIIRVVSTGQAIPGHTFFFCPCGSGDDGFAGLTKARGALPGDLEPTTADLWGVGVQITINNTVPTSSESLCTGGDGMTIGSSFTVVGAGLLSIE